MLRIKWPDTKEAMEELKGFIKEALAVKRGDGTKCGIVRVHGSMRLATAGGQARLGALRHRWKELLGSLGPPS